MKFEEIEVIIGPDGEITYTVKGIKGRKCLDITRDLEMDLGGEILSRENTWEMYEDDQKEYEISKERQTRK